MTKSNGRKPPKPIKRLADLSPQRRNINLGKPHGLAALDASLRRDGYSSPMVAAADGEVFAGSKRLERVADVMPSARPIVIHSDGTRPIVHIRDDIPTADDPRARRLGYADNAIAAMDWSPDGELLAALAAEDEVIAALAKQEGDSLRALQFVGPVPAFAPVGVDEQGRLDQKKPITCPKCGAEFVPNG